MTKVEAELLAAGCEAITTPETDATAVYFPPGKEWTVRLVTGDWKTVITEVTTAANAVRMHHKRNS